MWRVVEHLIVVLLLCVCAFQFLPELATHLAHASGRLLPTAIESTFATLFIGTFSVGLGVRLARWLRARDPLHERQSREHRAALAVRRPAEDVPAYAAPRELREDPDPALGETWEA